MFTSALVDYLSVTPREKIDNATVGYLANLSETAKVAPLLARAIVRELADQRANLKLIASENYCSLATQLTMGNLLTDKYAEGYPHSRFYAGCDNVDRIEDCACEHLLRCQRSAHPSFELTLLLTAHWQLVGSILHLPRLTPAAAL